jgi:dienelactone hydrolase
LERRAFCKVLAAGVALKGLTAVSEDWDHASANAVTPDGGKEQRDALELLFRVLPPSWAPATGRINAVDRTWEDWQRRTGELPPIFSTFPSQPFLPEVLAGVQNVEHWAERREEIRAQLEHWLTGCMPPAPTNLRSIVTAEKREGNVTIRDVRLEFGPEHRGTLRLQLLIPPHREPLPVFLTNHNRERPWTAAAVARGYMGVIYFAADPVYGFDDDSDQYIDLYPKFDFACIARWAWAASRAVDYLYTLQEVDRRSIAIAGHSRNAKQALIAAAFDERITAAVSSSGNTGASTPWRYTSDPFVTESIEQITTIFPHWFHPRLRFFAGREDKLPFDQNSVLALIAPRSLMLSGSCTEDQSCDLGIEHNYRALRTVYEFLGAPQNIGLRQRVGAHATTAGDIEDYIDFLDVVFARRSDDAAEPKLIFDYTFENWKLASGETSATKPMADALTWAIGPEPPQVEFPTKRRAPDVMPSAGWMELLYRRPIDSKRMKAIPVPFGVDLKADLYLPLNFDEKLPIVIWFHPYSYSTGYSRYAKAPFEELVRRGYGVLAFDQIGFGTRVEHAKDFYRRYPKWSLLGKMVADTRAAITAASALDVIDTSKIYALGYSLGGKVALWTAAFDARLAGVVSIAGVTPLRTSNETEGIRAYSHLHGLLPRLGFYSDRPTALPIDYDDVFRAIGRRRVVLIQPTHDRYTDLPALRNLVQPFANVEILSPEDFNRFPQATQTMAFDWLDRQRTLPAVER